MVGKPGCFEAWASQSQGGDLMETSGASSAPDGGDRLFLDPHHYRPDRAHLHTSIMMMMGCLASAVGELIFLMEGGCVILVGMGLVWMPPP